MMQRRRVVVFVAGLALVGVALTFLQQMVSGGDAVAQPGTYFEVTPVSGKSWLKRLGLYPLQTRMGRQGGMSSPSATEQQPELAPTLPSMYGRGPMARMMRWAFRWFRKEPRPHEGTMAKRFLLSGADLYRLNCQSCHGPDGTGAPPEILSLLEPVRGASPTLVKQRLADLDREIDDALAQELARSAEETVRQRLRDGGKKMPSFTHLTDSEIDALMQYLRVLAGTPEAEDEPMRVEQSVARVGEHLVKGTCQICHDATGPGPGHMTMMRGIIPSLASFPRQRTMQQVIQQVKRGSPRMMRMHGLDMPAYPYLTDDEIAAAYLYLAAYPPKQ